MAMNEECPICTYPFSLPFKAPRLLPCRHTFCNECVDSIIVGVSSETKKNIKCPVCRIEAHIPAVGSKGFVENYFKAAKVRTAVCDVCNKESTHLQRCAVCNGVLCDLCHSEHYHAAKQTDDEEENEDERVIHDLLHQYHHRYKGQVPTIQLVDMTMSFKCSPFTRVKKISIKYPDECWVLPNDSYMVNYDVNGKERTKHYISAEIMDFEIAKPGELIIAVKSGQIFRFSQQLGMKEIRNINEFMPAVPSNLFLQGNRKLMVVAMRKDHPSNPNMIFHFDLENGRSNCIKREEVKGIQQVASISVNPLTGSRFLCDVRKGCVVILKEHRIDMYKGRRVFPRVEIAGDSLTFSDNETHLFQPKSVCCDSLGNTLVYDGGTKAIHVIDDGAQLHGIVFPGNMGTMGSISCISVDTNNSLWIGDMVSGIVRVYNTTEYSNILGICPSFNTPRRPDPPDVLTYNGMTLADLHEMGALSFEHPFSFIGQDDEDYEDVSHVHLGRISHNLRGRGIRRITRTVLI